MTVANKYAQKPVPRYAAHVEAVECYSAQWWLLSPSFPVPLKTDLGFHKTDELAQPSRQNSRFGGLKVDHSKLPQSKAPFISELLFSLSLGRSDSVTRVVVPAQ